MKTVLIRRNFVIVIRNDQKLNINLFLWNNNNRSLFLDICSVEKEKNNRLVIQKNHSISKAVLYTNIFRILLL